MPSLLDVVLAVLASLGFVVVFVALALAFLFCGQPRRRDSYSDVIMWWLVSATIRPMLFAAGITIPLAVFVCQFVL